MSPPPSTRQVQSFDEFHALVIGVSAYLHLDPLPDGIRRGAEELSEILADPQLAGYPAEQVHLLLDAEATRDNILLELTCLQSVSPDATVLLYFAGHGGRADSDAQSSRLFSVETDPSTPESLAATSISGEELQRAIEAITAARMLLIFDCCHAGGLGSFELPDAADHGLSTAECEALSHTQGRVVLASARPNERSWLPDGRSYSVFTGHFLAALRGAAASRQGCLYAWDLFVYIQPRVTADRSDQHPIFKATLEENFPVARYLGGLHSAADEAETRPFDAYLSYAQTHDDDITFVWDVLVPRLEAAGLTLAVSGDVETPGVARVVGAEQGIERSRRTVVVLSEAYLDDGFSQFIDVLAQTRGIEEGLIRLLPVRYGKLDVGRLSARLRMLVSLDLSDNRLGQRNFNRLVKALHEPVAASSNPL